MCAKAKQGARQLDGDVLVNSHGLWRNNPHLLEGLSKDSTSQSEFRFAIIQIWYAITPKNGEISPYSFCWKFRGSGHFPNSFLTSSLFGTISDTKVGNHKLPFHSIFNCSFQCTKVFNSCPTLQIVNPGSTLPSFVSLSMDISLYDFVVCCPTRAS